MSSVTLQEAQAELPRLIAGLQPGETLQILDRQQPIARLTAEPKQLRKKRQPGSAKGLLVVISEDEEHLKDFQEYMP